MINVLVVFIGVVVSYLMGSISFSRIIFKLKRPGEPFPVFEIELPDTDVRFVSDSSGATTIFKALGPKWGGITSLLDITKAVIPALVYRLLFPDSPVFLLVGFFSVLGHIYPVYYGFKGGRGSSVISGLLLVLDFFGTVGTALLGILLSVLAEQVTISRWIGRILMIPYLWFIYREPWYLLFIISLNALFFLSMHKELRQVSALKKEGLLPDQKTIAELNGIGSLYRLSQKISIPSMVRRIRKQNSSAI